MARGLVSGSHGRPNINQALGSVSRLSSCVIHYAPVPQPPIPLLQFCSVSRAVYPTLSRFVPFRPSDPGCLSPALVLPGLSRLVLRPVVNLVCCPFQSVASPGCVDSSKSGELSPIPCACLCTWHSSLFPIKSIKVCLNSAQSAPARVNVSQSLRDLLLTNIDITIFHSCLVSHVTCPFVEGIDTSDGRGEESVRRLGPARPDEN